LKKFLKSHAAGRPTVPISKRLLLAVLVWAVLLGGLFLYLGQRHLHELTTEYTFKPAQGDFALQINSTFPMGADLFALRSKEPLPAPLKVWLNGMALKIPEADFSVPSAVRLEEVQGIFDGRNEFYIESHPASREGTPGALKLELFRGRKMLFEKTLWTDGASKIASTFYVDLHEKEPEHKGHDG